MWCICWDIGRNCCFKVLKISASLSGKFVLFLLFQNTNSNMLSERMKFEPPMDTKCITFCTGFVFFVFLFDLGSGSALYV